MAEPSTVHHPALLFEGSILLLDGKGASGDRFTVLSNYGYHVVRAFHVDEVAALVRRRKDIVLIVIRQDTPPAQPQISRHMGELREEFPWLEYLIVADAGVQPSTREDADRILYGDDPDEFLAAATDAYNLARMQQHQAAERHNLERSLQEYKSRADAAFAQLLSHMRGQQPAIPDGHAAPDASLSSEEISQLIREERNRARVRERLFGPLALGHAGWLLVLALAEANGSGAELTVKSAAHTAGLPLSSALRKINELCDRRLLSRRRDTSDARRSFISLTDRTRAALQEYFSAVEAGDKR